MKHKIEKLKQIISTNEELLKYSNEIQDNLNDSQIIVIVEKILTDLKKYNDETERPAFYTELQTLLSKNSKDNPYKKPITE